jgi:ketosteroid isomerase-like protein
MKASWLRSLVLIAALGIACVMRAASPAVEAVLAADQARLNALMAGDAATLTRVFSDDLIFVHSDGRIEGKTDYVRNLLAGDTAYANARTLDLRTQEPAPGVVVLIGAQEMRKRLGPDWAEVKLRFLAVWRQEGSAWRMVSWQSMRPAGNSVVPKK